MIGTLRSSTNIPILRLMMGVAEAEVSREYEALFPDTGNPHSVGLGPPRA